MPGCEHFAGFFSRLTGCVHDLFHPLVNFAPIKSTNRAIIELATLPGREVGGVPLAAALCPHLAAEAALDVHQRLHVVRVVQDVPTQREENGNDGSCFM